MGSEKSTKKVRDVKVSEALDLANSAGYSLQSCRQTHGFWQVVNPRYDRRQYPCAKTAGEALDEARKQGAQIPDAQSSSRPGSAKR